MVDKDVYNNNTSLYFARVILQLFRDFIRLKMTKTITTTLCLPGKLFSAAILL